MQILVVILAIGQENVCVEVRQLTGPWPAQDAE
jgi:hypothetical protein